MKVRLRLRAGVLASALGLLPMLGCFGPSNDKGDDPGAGKRTNPDRSKTGGMGENRDNKAPGEGNVGAPGSDTGPEAAKK